MNEETIETNIINTPNESIKIQLGDIVRIISPNDDNLHNNIYAIQYIDSSIIKLLGINNKIVNLYINEDGSLQNESIETIEILSKSSNPSYAIQNNLLPNTWIDLYFGGDIPQIITGKITNLDEDQIEIKLVNTNDVIYIDFGYKGIPIDIPLERIVIREKPQYITEKEEEEKEEEKEEQEKKEEGEEEEEKEKEGVEILDEVVSEVDKDTFQTYMKDAYFTAEQIEFGKELDEITELIEVPEEEKVYGFEIQLNDMLNEILSKIPNIERTTTVLNNIHTMLERFKQLRQEYSTFDENGIARMPIKYGPNYKPIINKLIQLKQKLYWLIPVVSQSNKIYDIKTEEMDIENVNQLSIYDDLEKLTEMINTYKSNSIPDEQNKYNYYVNEIHNYWTPFQEPDKDNNIIYTKETNTNIQGIVSNTNDNDFSSYMMKESNLSKSYFVIQPYNIGEHTIKQVKLKTGGGVVTQKIDLTPNDSLHIKSILALPKNIVSFSRINLPSTNILLRAHFNQNFISYWKFLNENTNVNEIMINDLSKQIEYDKEKFLQNITHYTLNNSIIAEEKNKPNYNIEKLYKSYLDTIIPKTRILFHLLRNELQGSLSLHSILEYLEPFMIYHKDLTFQQYDRMTNFINYKIKEFKKTYIEMKQKLQKVFTYKNNKIIESLFKEFDNNTLNLFTSIYSLSDSYTSLTNYEILSRMNNIDYGNLFFAYNALENNYLIRPNLDNEIENIIINKSQNNSSNSLLSNENNCNKKILSKLYYELDELEYDNNREIYFDKMYDNSPDRNQKVVSGNYAVLYDETEEPPRYSYYIRDNNKWVLDKNISDKTSGLDTSIFCNTFNTCIMTQETNNNCIDTKSYNQNIANNEIENMLYKLDGDIEKYFEQNKQQLINEFNKLELKAKLLNTLHKNKSLHVDNIKYNLGKNISFTDTPLSPYSSVIDNILGLDDFIQKQNYIVQIVDNGILRNAREDEDNMWYYCNETDIKLLPTFFYKLAKAFINDITGENYIVELQNIINSQGEKSDNGDAIIDKYSGYVITNINLETDEGYTPEGFKINTKSIIEADLGDTLIQQTNKEKKKDYSNDPVAYKIYKTYTAMSKFLGLDKNIDSIEEFIMTQTILYLKKEMISEELYNKKRAQLISKSKKNVETYEVYYNQILLIITLCFLFIGIQTSIPSFKAKKTHPGCKKSFTGFPLDGEEDDSGLKYIACVANSIKSNIEPWDGILKMSQVKLLANMKNIIAKSILKIDVVQERIKNKLEYNLTADNEDIPESLDIKKWTTFLPHLYPINIKTNTYITNEFINKLMEHMKNGNKLQEEELNILRSNIIYLSLSIQNSIENIVEDNIRKFNFILKNNANEPFLENACCNDENINSLRYFIKRDNKIELDIQQIYKLQNILKDIVSKSRSPILYNPSNTRRTYPDISQTFSEEIIYRGFINYCKWNSDIPVSDDLLGVCPPKPSIDIKHFDNIDNTIEKLKNVGVNLNNQDFDNLLQVVNNKHIVPMQLQVNVINNVQRLRDALEYSKQTNNRIFNNEFINLFMNLTDTFDIGGLKEDTIEMRNMKNYLAKQNKQLETIILDFIKNNKLDITKKDFTNIKDCIEQFTQFKEIENKNTIDTNEQTTYNIIHFVQKSLYNFINIIPNIVINNVKFNSAHVPEHWKLSNIHVSDVKEYIEKHYLSLSLLQGNSKEHNLLYKLLNTYITNIKDILLFTENTIMFSPIYKGNNKNENKNENVKYYSIFENKLTRLLFKYYFLISIHKLIQLLNNNVDINKEIKSLDYSQDMNDNDIEGIDNEDIDIENTIETIIPETIDVLQGEKEQFNSLVANYIYVSVMMLCNDKKQIDYNYDTLMDRIFREKDREKTGIVEMLKNLTDEEREVENLLKKHKLGKWNVAQEKGFFTYQGETYDKEKQEYNKLVETLHGMAIDATNIETLEQQQEAAFIEAEEFDLSHIGEDNDNYGEEMEKEYGDYE